MKRLIPAGLFLVIALWAFGQDSAFSRWLSDRYVVYSDAGYAVAKETAERMEGALDMFADLMHFDTQVLEERKLRVRVFARKADFDTYLTGIISATRKNFVYIHYSNPEKSELVAFLKEDERDMSYSLLSQGFIQFIKNFVPESPLWLQEGVAIYLAASRYDPGTARYSWKPNYTWLETLRKLDQDGKLIPLDQLLLATREQAAAGIDMFYPECWALVNFLLESESRTYNRLFWDSVSALDASASLAENSKAVVDHAFAWVEPATLLADFRLFASGLKSFYDLVQDGIEQYKEGDLGHAEDSFQQAMVLEEENHVPYYYLGLIRYAEKRYFEAWDFYDKSLEYGADEALVKYAMGVNAYANNEFDDAVRYLQEAVALEPGKYRDEANKVMERIKVER